MNAVIKRRRHRTPLLPPALTRILVETAALVALHLVLVFILARVHLLEHLLAPGPGSAVALVVTAVFLVLRIFLIVLAPGWFAVRVWLLLTKDRPPPRD